MRIYTKQNKQKQKKNTRKQQNYQLFQKRAARRHTIDNFVLIIHKYYQKLFVRTGNMYEKSTGM